MSNRLFDIDDIPEVPLIREPRRSRGEHDARFRNDYPEEWNRCLKCQGEGWLYGEPEDGMTSICSECLGMGSVKRKVRLLAGFRCERCLHPYLGKGDAKVLGVERFASPHQWSPCDERCEHKGPWRSEGGDAEGYGLTDQGYTAGALVRSGGFKVEAEWRILTVHHLDGDKANLAWWNLATLCQRCHLEIQAKVVMERVYPHEHSAWFKPHAAGFYAKVYLGDDLTREETLAGMDELLALEAT